MCGFIGLYNKNFSNIRYSGNHLKGLLRHRGPDYASMVKEDNLLLVHNRLSIIDLSEEANQPFVSADTGNILVFNGEIYNYKQLKKKYKDIKWQTNSDTEVIIRLYDLLGTADFVDRSGDLGALDVGCADCGVGTIINQEDIVEGEFIALFKIPFNLLDFKGVA